MPSALQILPHYTYNEWKNWEGQWELIYGIPHAMSPMPVPRHQIVSSNMIIEFGSELKKCNNCLVSQPIDYKISEDTIVQPDLLIICQEVTKKFLDFPPVLVAEILSPSTVLKDRHTKFQLYERQQIKYYLIVSPDEEKVEVYEIEDGDYKLKQSGKDFTYTFSFEENCTSQIDFSEIW